MSRPYFVDIRTLSPLLSVCTEADTLKESSPRISPRPPLIAVKFTTVLGFPNSGCFSAHHTLSYDSIKIFLFVVSKQRIILDMYSNLMSQGKSVMFFSHIPSSLGPCHTDFK